MGAGQSHISMGMFLPQVVAAKLARFTTSTVGSVFLITMAVVACHYFLLQYNHPQEHQNHDQDQQDYASQCAPDTFAPDPFVPVRQVPIFTVYGPGPWAVVLQPFVVVIIAFCLEAGSELNGVFVSFFVCFLLVLVILVVVLAAFSSQQSQQCLCHYFYYQQESRLNHHQDNNNNNSNDIYIYTYWLVFLIPERDVIFDYFSLIFVSFVIFPYFSSPIPAKTKVNSKAKTAFSSLPAARVASFVARSLWLQWSPCCHQWSSAVHLERPNRKEKLRKTTTNYEKLITTRKNERPNYEDQTETT